MSLLGREAAVGSGGGSHEGGMERVTRGKPRAPHPAPGHSLWGHPLRAALGPSSDPSQFQGPVLSRTFSQKAVLTARGEAGPQESGGAVGGQGRGTMGPLNPPTVPVLLKLDGHGCRKPQPLSRPAGGAQSGLSSHVFCCPCLLSAVPRATVEIGGREPFQPGRLSLSLFCVSFWGDNRGHFPFHPLDKAW